MAMLAFLMAAPHLERLDIGSCLRLSGALGFRDLFMRSHRLPTGSIWSQGSVVAGVRLSGVQGLRALGFRGLWVGGWGCRRRSFLGLGKRV